MVDLNSKYSLLEKAPSNIALIKYMGKLPGTGNLPANPSLSYTLNHLTTSVAIKENKTSNVDKWEALNAQFQLTKKAQEKFLKHWQYLKNYFSIKGNYTIFSANNFPTACGLASSASSFAALTKAAYKLALNQGSEKLSVAHLANLSRKGSGSSCRSLLMPWVQWQEAAIKTVPTHEDYKDIKHNVLLISTKEKEVGSSEAHRRVLKHSHFSERIERSEKRFIQLKQLLLQPNQFLAIKDLVWKEFMDMHQLFETCPKAFSYFTPVVSSVLNDLNAFITKEKINLWVTMDAGPNIHLLYKEKEEERINIYLSQLVKQYAIMDLLTLNREKNV
ncbi:MAG: diphosphomevalonate decarboxylase [Bdellovibrionaceae bacterium]|nr:diphosphomevalonate decarboxylase [Pseudobdellovibrionaceae bacterium]